MDDAFEATDFATVYFDPPGKVCLLVSQARRGRATGEVGEPTIVTEAEFDSRVGELLLQHLDAYRSRIWSREIARRLGSPRESRDFTRKHLSVSIERLPSGDLVIIPLHHDKGGYTGRASERILVPAKDVPDMIALALRKAVSIAT
jgi:hypothetical protein